MVLVFHPVQVFKVGAHLPGGLGHLGHFDEFELLEIQHGFAHFIIQQRVPARALELGQDAHAVAGDGLGAFHFDQDIQQSERQQASLGSLDGRRNVREGEQETDDVLAVHDQLDQAVVRHVKNVRHCIVNITVGERIIFPVFDEGFVVEMPDTVSPAHQFFLALEILDPQVAAFQRPLGNAFHPLRDPERFSRQVAGDEIHFLLEMHLLDQLAVIRVVIVHHGHHLAFVVALDQQAIAVEG